MDDSTFSEQLKCPVCLEYAEDAVECVKCNSICCIGCVFNSNTDKYIHCPLCRNTDMRVDNSWYKEASFARKMINNVPANCPFECEAKTY